VSRGRALVALAFTVLARTGHAQAPQKPIEFRSQVAAVNVDAFVTRGGQPVPGLRASDFELRDNGVPQQIELRPLDQAGLVAFSEDVFWLADPSSDKAVVRRALGRLRASGATSVYDALYAGITLSEGELRPLVVLFSDGEDNTSWLGAGDLQTVAQRSNALVHVVGWRPPLPPEARPKLPLQTESAQDRALREIAEAAGGRFWDADSPGRLRDAFRAIADAMGHRYVLRYEPAGVERAGWHRIEARLRGVKGDVHVRRGYWLAP
jgi:VWFA-related protein